MRVSIIIPTYNRAIYLEAAIASALAQDYKDLEVVISDNASTDNTELVAKAFSRDLRVKYFKNPENIGMVRNWHKAVFEYAQGEWFLILSDDDILINSKFISQAMKIVESSKDVNVVYSNSYVYDESLQMVKRLTLPFENIENGPKVFSKRGTVDPQDFALCNVLFDRKKAIQLGAFSNSMNLSCDTELFLRLCLRGNVGVVPEYSSIYRVHSGNLLKTVSKNTELIVGSLDSLLVPLKEAIDMGVNLPVVREFVENSKLKREIIVCLLKISMVDHAQAIAVNEKLRQFVGASELDIFPSEVLFKIILSVANVVAPLLIFRRKLIFGINAIKRLFFAHQVYFEPLHKRVYVID